MRVAAIDVGTNSIHLLVAEVSAHGEVSMVEKARAQVMLGSGGIGQHRITDDAFARGVAALVQFKEAADSLGVEDIHAAATSAVREAANGADFCRQVKELTGIHIRIISGSEEARLIWLGARDQLDYGRGPAMLCDLGGGSTELVLCDRSGLLYAHSMPLGHIRLADRFHRADPLHPDERRAMKREIRAHLAPVMRRVPKGDVNTMVGTSGTIRCLARMATLARGDALPEHDHGLVLHRREVELLIERFEELPKDKVAALPGMDDKRRDTIASGAVLVREVMKALGTVTLTTSERSLRDGLVVDWVERHRPEIDLSGRYADPRERSVQVALRRFGVDRPHAEHVADLALQLFDATAALHLLPVADRELLRDAALLHDIGHHIADAGHHKHGQYLLKHIRMYGFTAPEMAVVANIVRYHSRSTPKGHHRDWRALSLIDRERVRVMAGCLRIADALDRSHNQPVRDLKVINGPRVLRVVATVDEGGELERWAAESRRAMLEAALGRPVVVEVVAPELPAEPARAPVP